MSSILFRLTFYILLISILACKNNAESKGVQKEIDPFEAALPHGDTLPENNLNESDRLKLANAIGRTVVTIRPENLIDIFKKKSNKLQVYAFWKLGSKACVQQNHFLRRLQNEVGMDKMELTFINLDVVSRISEVNVSLRTQSISEPAFIVSKQIFSEIDPQYRKIFSAKPPTILFIRNEYDTFESYSRNFEYDELYALVQPLLL